MDTYTQLKAGVRWMWSLGDYAEIAERLQPHADVLAAACGLRIGMEVLDVAAGNGNFALAAAGRGATVTATDLTPRMVELGRARTEAAGATVAWREADAEELPFPADQFDVVGSVFGAMFAPRPELVAAELFRVTRPGGLVAMANYGWGGYLGRTAALMADYAGPAPFPMPSPFEWGDPETVRLRFAGLAASVAVEPRTLAFTFDSPEEREDFWERTNGPMIALRSRLADDRFQEVRERSTRLAAELNRAAGGGGLVLESDYLLVLARKP